MKQYLDLLRDIKENGIQKTNRTGTDTISVFGRQIRFNIEDGVIPLLTTKKIHTKSVIHELLWFLGNHMKMYEYKNLPMTNTRYLTDNGVSIWNEWADENGDLGKIYGYQWTKWNKINVLGQTEYINQIDNLINDLINNPDSRRLMVTAWNPSQLYEMNLPPCHYGFQCYSVEMDENERFMKFIRFKEGKPFKLDGNLMTAMDKEGFPRRKLSLMWNQRSVDTFLGLPFNIASYSILTYMLAMVTNHYPHEVIGNLGDTHLYVDHIKYVDEQLQRKPKNLPQIVINRKVSNIYDFKFEDFKIVNYDPFPNWKGVPIAV